MGDVRAFRVAIAQMAVHCVEIRPGAGFDHIGAGSFAERHARDEMEIGDGWILLDTGDQFFPIDVGKRDIHDGEMKGIVAKRGRSKEFYGHEAGVRLGHDGSPAG